MTLKALLLCSWKPHFWSSYRANSESPTKSDNSTNPLLLVPAFWIRSAAAPSTARRPASPPAVYIILFHFIVMLGLCILADTWCLFKKTKYDLTKVEILGYSPDESILKMYWKMCEQLLDVSDDTEDEEENREYIEEANADTVMFALAKLVATDTVAKEHLAPEIISHLEKYGASVGEIVKHLLTGLKKKGDVKRAYQRYLAATSSGNDEESSKKFQECKDLAARLSGSYVGVARNKYKSEILNVVREGINYAFSDAPKQLSFLDGALLYFVSKLPASDILDIW